MKHFLISIILFFTSQLSAQKIKFLSPDSLPVKNVLVANIIMDESVFSNKEGEAELTIFQDEEELLQIIHQSYKSIFLPKKILLEKGVIYLEKSTRKIAPVEVSVNSKTKESIFELITQQKSISKENIQQQGPATTAEILANTGQVQIQKSQLGGGSPILRGFEASRILLVVDGVRMNNAIYRSGHLQNAISVDPNTLEGVEVIFGPNSLMYGSDALGGVIHFKTRSPKFKKDSNNVERLDGFLRYQSALNSNSINIGYQNGTKNFAYLFGITSNTFGDLRIGENRFHGQDNFGKKTNYVSLINQKDSMLVNENQNIIVGSGYTQTDVLWKGICKINKQTNLSLNFQHSTTSNVPRVDKMNEYRDSTLRFSEWYYGPQKRTLASIDLEVKKVTNFFDYNHTIFAYQFIEEDRISREYKSNFQEQNYEDVSVYSFNSDFIKYVDTAKMVKINYGFEGLYNRIESEGKILNTETNQFSALSSRYPGDGSSFTSIASYISIQKKINNHIIKGGTRYTISNIISKFDSNEIVDLLNIQEKRLNNQSMTTSLGYVYHWDNYKFYSSVSTAFKAPNVDDFGKIFEKKGNLTVPNPNLEPETSLNYEIGSNLIHQYFDFDFAVFYTKVFNLMTKLPTEINGESRLLKDGDNLNLVSVQNNGLANIYGIFGATKLKFTSRLDLTSTFTLTKAHYANKYQPVGHIPPLYGMSSLSYKVRKIKYSLYSRFNSKKRWSDFNTLVDNPDEAVIGFGSPAWITLNASIFVYLNTRLKIQLAGENLLDAHYKTFSSGISAPGRNLIASVFFKF